MLDPSGIVPRHPILHLPNKDGESQNADIAQLLFGQALRRTISSAAFFALGSAVTALALYPDLHLTVLQSLKDATEPLGHTVAFFALTVVGTIAWGRTWPLIAGLCGLAVWLELAQFISPGREPDLVQVAGSLAGILLGLILARLWARAPRQLR